MKSTILTIFRLNYALSPAISSLFLMDYFIPLELERALSIGLLVHLILSSALNILAAYCLLRASSSNQRTVRSFLLTIQVIIFLFDLQMDLLIGPIPLVPIPAAYLTGLLSRLGIPISVLLGIFVCLAAMLMSAITTCFLHKHQTIIGDASYFKLSKRLYNFVYLAYLAFCIASFIAVSMWPLDKASSDVAMNSYSVNLAWIQSRGDYVVMEKSSMTGLASYIFLLATLGTLVIINFMFWHIYYTLNNQKSRRSVASQKMIKRSVFTLYIQLFVPCLFLGTPLFIDFISLATDSGNFTTCFISFFMLPLHSPVHSILLISITPAYRNLLFSIFNGKSKIQEVISANAILTIHSHRRF